MLKPIYLEHLRDVINFIDSNITFYLRKNELEFVNTRTDSRICVISPAYWGIIQFYDIKQCKGKEKELYIALEEFMRAVKITENKGGKNGSR